MQFCANAAKGLGIEACRESNVNFCRRPKTTVVWLLCVPRGWLKFMSQGEVQVFPASANRGTIFRYLRRQRGFFDQGLLCSNSGQCENRAGRAEGV